MKVYKLHLRSLVPNVIPECERVLSAHNQDDKLTIWYLHRPGAGDKLVRVAPTGGEVPNATPNFIGTVLLEQGTLVLHVFSE